jgi:hypothetical protein
MAAFVRIAAFSLACGALLSVIDWTGPAAAQDRAAQEHACGRDVSRYCRRVANDGDNAVYNCLLQNAPRLSAACRRVIGQ